MTTGITTWVSGVEVTLVRAEGVVVPALRGRYREIVNQKVIWTV